MKLLFAILLCILPVAWDLIIGRIYWKKKTVVQHMTTSGIRLAIIALLSILNPAVEFWRSALLAVGFHYFVFPILYNRLIIRQHWFYIGKTALLDKIESWVRSKLTTGFVLWFKIVLLLTAVKFYISVCFQWWCS